MNAAVSQIEELLLAEGLSRPETSSKMALFDKAAAALETLCGPRRGETRSLFVPGRIEVLGKHTDYAGGRSLLCTVERGFCVVAATRPDRGVHVVDAADGRHSDLALDPDLEPGSGWALYPSTVARRMARDFPGQLLGADIAFASDLPAAAGLSSSSALCIALFSALADANGLDKRLEFTSNIRSPEDLAEYLSCLENGSSFRAFLGDHGVGAQTGGEDQAAILGCRRGQLDQYAFCPVHHERSVALPDDWIFVVASSGVASEKTGGTREKYNRLSRAANAVLELWRQASGRPDTSLLTAATSANDAPERIRDVLRRSAHADFSPRTLLDRFEQFFQESVEILPAAVEAIANKDTAALGQWVDRSQSAAERLLGIQIPETVGLARRARELGAIAASAFGGGFGGSVWALVPADQPAGFQSRWAQTYIRDFPARAAAARFFQTRPGPPLCRLYPVAGGRSFQ